MNDDQEPSVFCAALTCEGRGAHQRQSWISLDGICFCGRYPEKVQRCRVRSSQLENMVVMMGSGQATYRPHLNC